MAFTAIDKALDDAYEHVFRAGGRSVSKWTSSLDVFRTARTRYFDALIVQHGEVRILGMPKPVPLEGLYVRVRIVQDIRNRRYLDEQYLEYLSKQKTIPAAIKKELSRFLDDESADAIETIEASKRVILHGGPGRGKTTFLRYLALYYAGLLKKTPDTAIWKFPVLITLRDLNTNGASFLKLLKQQLGYSRIPEPEAFLERLLDQGRVVLLLDGLDEVVSKKHANFVKQLKEFIARHPKCLCILSSRTIDALTQLDTFTELEIVEFGEDEVKQFVQNWFKGANQSRGRELIHKIANDTHLRELATTPLLLSLLCILYNNDLQIPKNRAELYTRCIECLLREWDSSRGFRRDTEFDRLSDVRKLQMFTTVAHKFFSAGHLFFRKPQLTAVVSDFLADLDIPLQAADDVLTEIESHHGIITRRGKNVYAFSHLTYQEYFTARYFVERNEYREVLSDTANPRWQEVICLVASMLPDATAFVRGVLANIDQKKLELLAEKGKLGNEYLLLRSLVQSELSLGRRARQQLYTVFVTHHERVFAIPWDVLQIKWRYSPKSHKVMVNLGFQRNRQLKFRITSAVASFRNTLEIVSTSDSFLRHYAASINRNGGSARPSNALSEFLVLCEDVQKRGGGFRIRLV